MPLAEERNDDENTTLAATVVALKKQAPGWGIERETAAYFTAIAPKVGGIGRPFLELLAEELEQMFPKLRGEPA